MLGVAYAVLEEGIMVKSFFDPTWPDLGLLAIYGRWAGVNWVWAAWLSIYHSVYSITIPILLVELTFPEFRPRPYLGRKGLTFFFALIISVVAAWNLLETRYTAAPSYLLACLLVIAILACSAKRLPALRMGGGGSMTKEKRLWATGFLMGASYFFLFFNALPAIGLPPLFTMVMMALFTFAVVYMLLGFAKRGFREAQGLALAAGMLSVFIALGPILELSPRGTRDFTGESLVSVSFVVFLVWLRRRVRSEDRVSKLRGTQGAVQAANSEGGDAVQAPCCGYAEAGSRALASPDTCAPSSA